MIYYICRTYAYTSEMILTQYITLCSVYDMSYDNYLYILQKKPHIKDML